MVRILFMNVGGLPFNLAHPKNSEIWNLIGTHHIDIMGMAEVNISWYQIPEVHRLRDRVLSWCKGKHVVTAHNCNDNMSNRYQWGGIAMMSITQVAYQVLKSGQDPSNLGCWVWTRYCAQNRVVTQVIMAYRPCVPSTGGAMTVYAQHKST